MVTIHGNLALITRTSRNAVLESLHPKMVHSPSNPFLTFSFLEIYIPLRDRNPKTHTSISLNTIATIANVFLSRAAHSRGEEFLEWDADDVVGVCINLIDQVGTHSLVFRKKRN
jgi:hypothetical protein